MICNTSSIHFGAHFENSDQVKLSKSSTAVQSVPISSSSSLPKLDLNKESTRSQSLSLQEACCSASELHKGLVVGGTGGR